MKRRKGLAAMSVAKRKAIAAMGGKAKAALLNKCPYCKKEEADKELTFEGKAICRGCAHNASHCHPLRKNELPCPVVDELNRVLAYGVYPNIDMS